MRGKYCFCILSIVSLIYTTKSQILDERPQTLAGQVEVDKNIGYFVRDNELGSQWPHGIIPYFLNADDYDHLVSLSVRMAMNTLEDTSCIKFKALSEPNHFAPWIHISNPHKIRDCVHTVENKTGLEVPLVLGYDCLQRREVLHSMMHAIGFKDEVAHPLRDQYIRIQWENIHPKYVPLFRVRYDDFSPVKVEYDPNSIMHFHDRAFSRNGQATIAPVMPGLVIDPSGELSPLDKMKLRLVFGHECNKRKVGDLLDSCKIVMRHDPDETTDKEGLNTSDETGHSKDNKDTDETEGEKNKTEQESDNDSKKEQASDNNEASDKDDDKNDKKSDNDSNTVKGDSQDNDNDGSKDNKNSDNGNNVDSNGNNKDDESDGSKHDNNANTDNKTEKPQPTWYDKTEKPQPTWYDKTEKPQPTWYDNEQKELNDDNNGTKKRRLHYRHRL